MKKFQILSWATNIILGGFLASSVSFPWVKGNVFDAYAMIAYTFKKIHNDYVTPIDSKVLARKVITNMTDELDQWSTYFSPDEYVNFDEEIEGKFGGIGIFFEIKENGLLIKTVLPDGPADVAGLRKGFMILSAAGVELKNKSSEEIKRLIRGSVGTELVLVVQNLAGLVNKVTIMRRIISAPSVHRVVLLSAVPPIGMIRVERFQGDTTSKIKAALKNLSNKHIQGLILDLRNNPGGLYKEAIKVADLFLSKGIIVRTKGRKESEVSTIYAKDTCFKPALKIAVLIDSGTASAAELVSGALRENRRAILVGEQSYGKFCVQTIYELMGKGRLFGALKLTTKRYMTPNGNALKDGHLKVDVKVKLAKEKKEKLLLEWRNDLRKNWETPTALQQKPVNLKEDPCIQKALEILSRTDKYDELLSAPHVTPGTQ